MPLLTDFSKQQIVGMLTDRLRREGAEVERLRNLFKEICCTANDVSVSEDNLREFIFTKTKEALKGG